MDTNFYKGYENLIKDIYKIRYIQKIPLLFRNNTLCDYTVIQIHDVEIKKTKKNL